MAGERTIVRIYMSRDGRVGIDSMTQGMDLDDAYKIIGALEMAKDMISGTFPPETMTQDEVDDTRKLLDG